MTFNEFLNAIDDLAAVEGAEISYTAQTGIEAWRQAYDADMTPEEAWEEEKIAGYAGD